MGSERLRVQIFIVFVVRGRLLGILLFRAQGGRGAHAAGDDGRDRSDHVGQDDRAGDGQEKPDRGRDRLGNRAEPVRERRPDDAADADPNGDPDQQCNGHERRRRHATVERTWGGTNPSIFKIAKSRRRRRIDVARVWARVAAASSATRPARRRGMFWTWPKFTRSVGRCGSKSKYWSVNLFLSSASTAFLFTPGAKLKSKSDAGGIWKGGGGAIRCSAGPTTTAPSPRRPLSVFGGMTTVPTTLNCARLAWTAEIYIVIVEPMCAWRSLSVLMPSAISPVVSGTWPSTKTGWMRPLTSCKPRSWK